MDSAKKSGKKPGKNEAAERKSEAKFSARHNTKDTVNSLYGQQIRVRACGLLLSENGLLLARHKGLGPAGTLWVPPGGGVDFGEHLRETMRREFEEETGLQIAVQELVHVHEFVEPPLHALEFFFRVTQNSGSLQKGTDPEITTAEQLIEEVRFVSLAELELFPRAELHPVIQGLASWHDLFSLKPGV